MRTYKHLMEKAVEKDNIVLAVHNAGKGRKNKRLKQQIRKEEEFIDVDWDFIKDDMLDYQNEKHTPKEIYDGITRKKRTIIVPSANEQIVHHAIVNVLKPIFMTSMYQHSYGSLPGRGGHKAAKWINKHIQDVDYILKMDIRKYFDNVDQDILIAKLRRIIKDEEFMHLLEVIIRVIDHGIPLGFYTSQWFANFYLTELDHYITDELGFGLYVRYMDDMVIMGKDKKVLHEARRKIETYIKDNLGLELKDDWQVFKFDERPLDFMGFKFYKNRTTIRKSILKKARRKAYRMGRKEKVNSYEARQMLSYLGWLKATDTYRYQELYINPYVNFKKLERIVSKNDKKKNQQEKNKKR